MVELSQMIPTTVSELTWHGQFQLENPIKLFNLKSLASYHTVLMRVLRTERFSNSQLEKIAVYDGFGVELDEEFFNLIPRTVVHLSTEVKISAELPAQIFVVELNRGTDHVIPSTVKCIFGSDVQVENFKLKALCVVPEIAKCSDTVKASMLADLVGYRHVTPSDIVDICRRGVTFQVEYVEIWARYHHLSEVVVELVMQLFPPKREKRRMS